MVWEFKQGGTGKRGWHWRCIDADTGSVLKICHALFNTLYDCLRDAELHGFSWQERSCVH
jgi:hypothetical protein